MAFALKGFRSLWGAPSAKRLGLASTERDQVAYADALFARIAAQGFDGVEASLGDLAQLGSAVVVNDLLAKHELQLIVGVYSGWVDYEDRHIGQQFESVKSHVERYKRQLVTASEAFPTRVWTNAHTGSDHWPKLDQIEFVAHAFEIESRLGIENVSYETHRGRIFYSPWPTLELLAAFPAIKLTLDLSHWCVATERLLDTPHDERHLWARVLPHVHHVHGRVGSAQQSQLAQLPESPHLRPEVERFEALWTSVWEKQFARSQHTDLIHGAAARAFTTFTPEYGPVPYAPRDAQDSEQDAYDVDALCASQMERQRGRFSEFLGERELEQAAKDYA
jgi:hypothetical protein